MNTFWNTLKSGLIRGAGMGIGLLLILFTSMLLAEIVQFQPGELISAKQINANFNSLEDAIATAVPPGFIAGFYLSECPAGWTQADGNNGTPDLRGVFLRGLNTFDAGLTVRSDGSQDPDGAGRTIGNYQPDQFRSHTHTTQRGDWGSMMGGGTPDDIGWYATNTGAAGGNETRPRNVALIFCMRETP